MSHPFLREGTPAEPRGGGVPVCNQDQEEGRGAVISHPFQEGGGGP